MEITTKIAPIKANTRIPYLSSFKTSQVFEASFVTVPSGQTSTQPP